MATSKATRINVSTMTETVDTLEVGNWKLTFNYKNETGKPISQLNVNGNNDSNGSFSYNKQETQTFVQFINSNYDADLVKAINDEVTAIVSV